MAELVTQELDLDYARFEQGARKVAGLWDELDTRSDRMGKESPFAKQTSDALRFNNQLRSGNDLYKRLESAPKQYKAEAARLSAELAKLITNQEKAGKAGNWKDNQEQIKRTRTELDALNKKYDETITKQNKARDSSGRFTSSGGSGSSSSSGGFLSGLADKIPGGIAGVLGGLGIGLGAKEIITGIVSVRAEYQRLEKQLEVTLGSKSAAVAAQELITNFANKTSHEIAGVTSAFNRLVDIGIVPTEKQLFQLSDIALSKGKTINDYVEAIADAQTGEFERLKEFGIKASKAGDQITFSFKGQQTTVQNTTQAIDDYLLSLGDVPGVAGQTAEAGKLLEGRYSTLKDTFAGIANDLGILLQPALEKVLDVTQQAASGLAGYIKDLSAVGGKEGGIRAFFRSVFDPNGFNADATEAIIQANEKAEAANKKSGGIDPLEAKRNELAAQQRKAEAERKAAADAKKAEEDAKKAKAKQQQINLDLTREAEKLVEDRKKLQDELAKLESDGEKLRLDTLDKNGNEYLALKRKLDLEEIEIERKKYIELGQQATGTPFYNTKTKRVETRPNLAYQLPAATEAIFAGKRSAVDLEGFRAGQGQYEAQQKADRKAFNDAEDNYDKEQATKRRNNAIRSSQIELDLREALYEKSQTLSRQAGESELDYEKRKNQALLELRLEYYENLLKLAKNDPSQKEQLLGLKETIASIRGELKAVKAQAKTGPQDLFDLLGITFDADPAKNDQIKAAVNESVQTVVVGAQQILQQQLASDQAEIQSIDARLQAKQSEVQTEATLAAAGLANSLSTKKKEEAALKAERAKAVEDQRRDQAIQIGINTLLQESNMALAVAKLLASSSELGPFGIIAAGISIGAMFALFASSIAQISSLPKYHDGDEVTRDTALRRMRLVGSPHADEVDARLQIGEGVTRKESYQPNKKLFARLNALGRAVQPGDLASLLAGTGVELPESVVQGDLMMIRLLNDSRQSGPDRELHGRIDALTGTVTELLSETRQQGKQKSERLPDGRVRQTDAHGNVTLVRYT